MKAKQLIFNKRPNGMPDDETFQFRETELGSPADNEVLLKTLYVSVDPYMRGRMSDKESYAEPFEVGKPMAGLAVAQVLESASDDFQKGDIIRGNLPFQTYLIEKADHIQKIDTHGLRPSAALSVFGMPALTAYFGMMHIGKPEKGDNVVISGAAGAVGQIAGQLAKQAGAHVVGIVGSAEKAKHITETLGFDAAVEYKKGNISQQLKAACPNGIDIYFENVGGEIGDAVWPLLNTFARVPVCGAISSYNLKEGEQDIGLRIQPFLIKSRATMQGFLVGDFAEHFKEASGFLAKAVKDGSIIFKETITEGFDRIPDAFAGLFKGENIGKQLVKVAVED